MGVVNDTGNVRAGDTTRVVIIGGGFGGLAVSRALARAPVHITIVDKNNYHLFQPLLYQVATSSLGVSDITAPIRYLVRGQRNCEVALAEVASVDIAERRVHFKDGHIAYDYLIIAAGATHAYFGNDHWAQRAPGLKGVLDAVELQRRILLAFESAEYEGSEESRRATLTFGIVGGGPTGVELAGAIKEIAGKTLPKDYRHIDTRTTRVILFQGADRLLPPFSPRLSERAKRDLTAMGVEVRLNTQVTDVLEDGVKVKGKDGEEFIPLRNVFWAAGVQGNSLGATLGTDLDRAGRVVVGGDLSVPDYPHTFVIGDLASAKSADTGKPVPGVAQGAIQMGRYVARVIRDELAGGKRSEREFCYKDKGSMAIIGKSKAVAQVGRLHMGGFPGWLLWGGIHILFLSGFRNRAIVSTRWLWSWILNSRDARIIVGDSTLQVHVPRPPEFQPSSLQRRPEYDE